MTTKNETEHLKSVVVEPAQPACSSVIWLHGLGADGHDFEPIASHLQLSATRFVFPHAPIRPVTINNGVHMRAWYDITSPDIADASRADATTIELSVQQVRDVIAAEMARGIAAENIVLAGFSQGGVIALQTALSCEYSLAGLLVLSSYIAMPEKVQAKLHAANSDIPIFVAHGEYDAVLPYHLCADTQRHLHAWGFTPVVHRYAMEHNVSPEEIADIATWLRGLAGVR